MSASREHKPLSSIPVNQLARFAVSGVSATLLYVLLALGFDIAAPTLPGYLLSFLAYAICSIYSYLAHKFFTFESEGAHRVEGPRFLVLTAAGYGIATSLTALLHDIVGWPMAAPVLMTAVLVPCVNYIGMRYFVFTTNDSK